MERKKENHASLSFQVERPQELTVCSKLGNSLAASTHFPLMERASVCGISLNLKVVELVMKGLYLYSIVLHTYKKLTVQLFSSC